MDEETSPCGDMFIVMYFRHSSDLHRQFVAMLDSFRVPMLSSSFDG